MPGTFGSFCHALTSRDENTPKRRQAGSPLVRKSFFILKLELPSLERKESFAFQHMGRFFAFVGEEIDGQPKRKT